MVKSWILDYATPTTIDTAVVTAPTGFLRAVVVIIKAEVDETSLTQLTTKPATSISGAVDGLFDGGLSAVNYIKRINADLPVGLSLDNEAFSVILDGYNDAELTAKDLQGFKGTLHYEVDTTNAGVETNTDKVYNPAKDGYTAGYTLGRMLSSTEWSNNQYISTPANVYVVTDLGAAETLFNARTTFWGRDDVAGTRLCGAFVGGNGFTKPYIEEEIAINLQANNLNLLAGNLKNTLQDCKIVELFNRNYINEFYLNTGLITAFDYEVKLSSEVFKFQSKLAVAVAIPVWIINMNITAKL